MKKLKLLFSGDHGAWFITGMVIGIGLTLMVVALFMYLLQHKYTIVW